MIDDYSVYANYIVGFKPGVSFVSPIPAHIRGKADTDASFRVNYFNNKLYWYDFGFKSKKGYDSIGFYATMEEISRDEAYFELSGNKKHTSKYKHSVLDILKVRSVKLVYDYGPDLTWQHKEYFKSLYIFDNLLELYRVTRLYRILTDDYKPSVIWRESDWNFGFYYDFLGEGHKGYLPFNKKKNKKGKLVPDKFYHQGMNVLEGWFQLDFSKDHIVITKSYKDVIVLRSCGYNAIACSSETTLNVLKNYAGIISLHFENIIIWGDPDPAGVSYSNRVKKMLGRGFIANSIYAKDPSDIIIETSTRFWIHKIISDAGKHHLSRYRYKKSLVA